MQTKENRDNIRIIKSFILSLLMHVMILLLFWVSAEKFFSSSPPKQEKRFTMDLSRFVPPAPPPKPKVVPVPVQPKPVVPQRTVPKPVPKPKPVEPVQKKPEPVKRVLEEKKILTAKKDTKENNVTKAAEKPAKKIVKKEKRRKEEKKIVKRERKEKKKRIAKKTPRRRPQQKKYASSLANSLMGSNQQHLSRVVPRSQISSSTTKRMIKKLYGSEFNGYSPEQKKFIKNNLAIIHSITQMTLVRNGYPETAVRTGQQGINVVSFYLHPNGNITGLHLDKRMGYEALDRNTLQVIRIAYKDYPLPTKKTKIKFFVQYSINGY